MGAKTEISWTTSTWNPTTGCDRVSPGCDHCYALTLAERFRGTPGHYFEHGFDVQLRPDKLDLPLRWKKPRKVFVNSMSDLFHKDIPDEYIARVFAVMALAPQHTFQVLTKRHGRMRSLLRSAEFQRLFDAAVLDVAADHAHMRMVDYEAAESLPLPNVWLGISAENQHWADIRIPALLATPAAVRFISAEPLLGPIDLFGDLEKPGPGDLVEGWTNRTDYGTGYEYDASISPGLDWVIVGGESGRGARPMDLDWARSIRDQCGAAGVAFHYKQQGSGDGGPKSRRDLDGRAWDEFPAVAV